jgi:hypothetical protein
MDVYLVITHAAVRFLSLVDTARTLYRTTGSELDITVIIGSEDFFKESSSQVIVCSF